MREDSPDASWRDEVLKSIRSEVRAELMFYAPRQGNLAPPNALQSEEYLISAVLDGHGLKVIGTLTGVEFYHPLHRAILASAKRLPEKFTLEQMVEDLWAAGCVGDLLTELQGLKFDVPYRVDLPVHVEAVREAWKKRELIAWLNKVEFELRAGTLTADEARERIRPREKATEQKTGRAPVGLPQAPGAKRSRPDAA